MGLSAISNVYANQTYAGLAGQRRVQEPGASQETPSPTQNPQEAAPDAAHRTEKKAADGKTDLTPEQVAQLTKLRARDREVRQHEAAHLAASGGLATSGASFSYQKGPDGVNYAVGGEVQIDTSSGRTPQESIERARTIQAAALAPAQPSGQDKAVAAAAQKMELQARAELAQQAAQKKSDKTVNGQEEATESDSTDSTEPNNPADPTSNKATPDHARAAQAYAAVGAISNLAGGLALGTIPATARRPQVHAYA